MKLDKPRLLSLKQRIYRNLGKLACQLDYSFSSDGVGTHGGFLVDALISTEKIILSKPSTNQIKHVFLYMALYHRKNSELDEVYRGIGAIIVKNLTSRLRFIH